jgi:putative DNA primase/helicase
VLLHSSFRKYENGQKKFKQCSWTDGQQKWNLKGIEPVLFRLPQLIEAIKRNETVFIPEGEKDVLNLDRTGLVATTNAMGAGKWRHSYNSYFKGADVVILSDNDKVGHEHAYNIFQNLKKIAKSVIVLELPGLKEKEDISDWLHRGGSKEKLLALVAEHKAKKSENDFEFEIRRSDQGNAMNFVKQYGDQIKYNFTTGKWLSYNGKLWLKDEVNHIQELAKATIKRYESITDNRKLIKPWILKSENRPKLVAMIKLASSDKRIAATQADFDSDPYKVNLLNGTFDFKQLKLLPHNKDDLMTKIIEINYDESIGCAQWGNFLKTIFCCDSELIKFVQKAVGYSFVGIQSEEIMFFCHGKGKNGKSVFFNMMESLFGDYFQKGPTDLILQKNNDGVPNDIARLAGSRFVLCGEIPENRKLHEQKIKDLTGGDRLVGRFLFKEFDEFSPTHSLWIFGNHKPRIVGTDEGIWRRICLIPFLVQIPEEKRIPRPELLAKLRQELSGIFNWAVQGWIMYISDGMKLPEAVINANSEYRLDSDVVKNFIDECCDLGVGDGTLANDLFKEFQTWAGNGESKMSRNKFYQEMEGHGLVKDKQPKGNYVIFKGLQIKSKTV